MKKLATTNGLYLPLPQSPIPTTAPRLRPRVPRPRCKSFLHLLLSLLSLTLIILYFRDDISELPDRWHGTVFNPEPASSLSSPHAIFSAQDHPGLESHPIDTLIDGAEAQFGELLSRETHSVGDAARAYRRRRGRHPPPWFDEWVRFAEDHDAVVIEDLFDQIYHDINPLWAVPAHELRTAASKWPYNVKVRNGTVSQTNSNWNFVNVYTKMLKKLTGRLPDVDIPINEMDEPRLLVEWEKIDFYMSTIQNAARDKDPRETPTVRGYSSLTGYKPPSFEYPWAYIGPYWNFVRTGCPAKSYARKTSIDADFTEPPMFPDKWPNETYMGFIANFSIARDPCMHPHLRNMHGTFVEPISQSTSNRLFPMFSGAKLPTNNDVLLPATMYWTESDSPSDDSELIPWASKHDKVVWRGSASGGRNRVENWTRFHRHRFLSMLNGTQVEMTEFAQQWVEETDQEIPKVRQLPAPDAPPGAPETFNYTVPRNFPLPDQRLYPLRAVQLGVLADWVRSFSNSAFVWLNCFPATRTFSCSYTGDYYRRMREMKLERHFHYKYLPDIDGNGMSPRFRQFLKSNSLPIKSTIYKEWHDDRLVPWKHFVPMDNTYMDFYSIMEYLLGHDRRAQRIAEDGKRWADRVLRKEDMLVYVYRLVLEYARVCDPLRHHMGWVGDLE
ncbi:MAG: hypothetical protein Q9162_000881 [Coniocarpon cinnabarinum]